MKLMKPMKPTKLVKLTKLMKLMKMMKPKEAGKLDKVWVEAQVVVPVKVQDNSDNLDESDKP